jgi:5-methylcytosine-specific restriction endonuclease McrA
MVIKVSKRQTRKLFLKERRKRRKRLRKKRGSFGAGAKGRRQLAKRKFSQIPDFYRTELWMILRRIILNKHGRTCMRCGKIGKQMHVDHVLPRKYFPELELEQNNLQILCAQCNRIKLNKYGTDWDFRPKSVL